MSSGSGGWVGVDLDGTLADYDDVWRGPEHIGQPIPKMVDRVKRWLAKGLEVRVFTARVCGADGRDIEPTVKVIQDWCLKHIGQVLPVTNLKDYSMIRLWDDRAVQVEQNTGRAVSPQVMNLLAEWAMEDCECGAWVAYDYTGPCHKKCGPGRAQAILEMTEHS